MTTITELADLFIHAFPSLDSEGQQRALQLYRLLAAGQPVSVATFADAINLSETETSELLERWTGVYLNDTGDIIGFWGLSVVEMPHQISIDGVQLFTWCAWDTLFIPMILNKSADVVTHCPVSKNEIRLSVTPEGIETMSPRDASISFIKPELEKLKENVINSFCQQIFFLDSAESGKQWCDNHPDAFILSMNEGFELGKKIVTRVFFE